MVPGQTREKRGKKRCRLRMARVIARVERGGGKKRGGAKVVDKYAPAKKKKKRENGPRPGFFLAKRVEEFHC